MSYDNNFSYVQNKAYFIRSLTTATTNTSQFNLFPEVNPSSYNGFTNYIGPTGSIGSTGLTGATGNTGPIGSMGSSKGFNVVFGANMIGNEFFIYNGSAISTMSSISIEYKTRFYIPVNATLTSFSFATQNADASTRLTIKKNGTSVLIINDLQSNNGYKDISPITFNKRDYCEVNQISGTFAQESTITLYFT